MLYYAEEIFAVEGFLINFAELFFAIQENEPIFAELTFVTAGFVVDDFFLFSNICVYMFICLYVYFYLCDFNDSWFELVFIFIIFKLYTYCNQL